MKNIFSGKKAIVYDRNMSVLAGGQREVFAFAKALSLLGYNTQVLTETSPAPNLAQIRSAFGDEFDTVKIKAISGNIEKVLQNEKPDLFFNQSHMHFVENSAPLGIYRQMFPVTPVWCENAPATVEILQSYSLILNNSSFTKKYTDIRWDFPLRKSLVILPPLAERASNRAKNFPINFPQKEKKIFTLGRFTQPKNQELLIKSFIEAKSKFPVLHDWQLIVIGMKQHDEESMLYFDKCKNHAKLSKGDVSIESNISYEKLEHHMTTSFGFAHAMGAFHLPNEEPHLCEHYGLCTVEAMAHGCIPLVYARSGVFDVLDVSQAGIPFITREGLMEGYAEIAEHWQNPDVKQIQEKLMKMALQTNFEKFTERLETILVQELKS